MFFILTLLTGLAFGQEQVTSPETGKDLRLAWAKAEAGGPIKPLTRVGVAVNLVGAASLFGSMIPYASLQKQANALQDPQHNFTSEADHNDALQRYSGTLTQFNVTFWGGLGAYAAGMSMIYLGEIEIPYRKWKRDRLSASPTVTLDEGTPNFGVYGRF